MAEKEAKSKPKKVEAKPVETKEATVKKEVKAEKVEKAEKSEDKVVKKVEAEVKEGVEKTAKADSNEEAGEVKKDVMLKSDIGLNDPNSQSTTEKLKDILKTGAFSFNQKEKAALAKILGTAE